jgi:hypothetical protein
LLAQSTQGLIEGRIVNESTRLGIAGASVSAYHVETQKRASSKTDGEGRYVIPSLSPGTYSVRAEAPGYQARETNLIRLPVAGRTELEFSLRLLTSTEQQDPYSSTFVPGENLYVHTYTADVQTTRIDLLNVISGLPGLLESTLSYVVWPEEIDRLPLAGRDLYGTLALQPGVTAYSGTSRGLGLTVNGQRPSATNFLLDGVENDNYLTTGPLTTLTPEGMLEYRISTHNFSAEYGRTSGVIANAVSRLGTDQWHGMAYAYFKHEKLNANGWQENAQGISRAPLREGEFGASSGARLRRNLFGFLSFDWLRYRSRDDPVDWLLPTREWIAGFPAAPDARRLLRQYALPIAPSARGLDWTSYGIAPTVTINRYSSVPRLDYTTSGEAREHIAVRAAVSQLRQPDLYFSPYPGFSAPFRQGAVDVAGSLTTIFRAWAANEFRVAESGDSTRVDRVHTEVPSFESGDGVTLPGSPAELTFHNNGHNFEIADGISVVVGRNLWKFGGGFLDRRVKFLETPRADGLYVFDSLTRFGADEPKGLWLSYDRSQMGNFGPPPFDAGFSYRPWYWFAQHSVRATSRLNIDYGFRYEHTSAPELGSGYQADEIVLGKGSSLPQRLNGATWALTKGRLYSTDASNPTLRTGIAYDLGGTGNTILRASYGWFYDRPFDTLWQGIQANHFVYGHSNLGNTKPDEHTPVSFLSAPYSIAASAPPPTYSDVVQPVLYQPNIRSARAQNFFLGIQQRVPGAGAVEAAYVGSIDSGLITTDLVNRPYSVPKDNQAQQNSNGSNPHAFNPGLPVLEYRANQGKSSYHALTVTLRIDSRHVRAQAAYTWSHSIDLQSDPLASEFFAFNFFNRQRVADHALASFTRQFDSQADRANSDFDQRQNFVLYGIADLPTAFATTGAAPLLRNWQTGWMGAIRSGFPYTVFVSPADALVPGIEYLYNVPADLRSPQAAQTNLPYPQGGGRTLLREFAFGIPAAGQIGTSGRNRFSGPGLISLDWSLARSFQIPRWERGRILLRCDAYNILNHANLNNPLVTTFNAPGFGVAYFGRQESNSGFPLLVPFSETSRTIQLMLRFEF